MQWWALGLKGCFFLLYKLLWQLLSLRPRREGLLGYVFFGLGLNVADLASEDGLGQASASFSS